MWCWEHIDAYEFLLCLVQWDRPIILLRSFLTWKLEINSNPPQHGGRGAGVQRTWPCRLKGPQPANELERSEAAVHSHPHLLLKDTPVPKASGDWSWDNRGLHYVLDNDALASTIDSARLTPHPRVPRTVYPLADYFSFFRTLPRKLIEKLRWNTIIRNLCSNLMPRLILPPASRSVPPQTLLVSWQCVLGSTDRMTTSWTTMTGSEEGGDELPFNQGCEPVALLFQCAAPRE